jgi:SlyX protein
VSDRIDRLEAAVADLIRMVDDLSAVTARQADTIDRLERRVALLVAREAERAAAEGGGVVIGDERPPHW